MRDPHTRRPIPSWRFGLVVLLLLSLTGVALPAPAPVAAAAVTLAADRASGQPVGTTVAWTAIPADDATREYRFSVALNGAAPTIVRDFSATSTFTWTPLDEGTYTVTADVRAKDDSAAPDETVSVPYTIVSRITAGQPVVSGTAHPLVALYSIPPCGTGVVRVSFAAGSQPTGGQQTPAVACSPTASTNLYLVGLRPSTTYAIQYAVTTGATTSAGPVSSWTSGALPADVTFPAITAPVAPTADSDTAAGIVYQAPLALGNNTTDAQLYATDLAGNILWYLPYASNISVGAARPIPGGDTLAIVDGPGEHLIRVLDPVGNPVRETSLTSLNEQLAALPQPAGRTLEPLRALHHEVNLLPNGHIVALGFTERLFPAGTQGSTTGLPVDLVGDEIVDLDPNLQVDWAWNAFDYLDPARGALLDEDCVPPGCAAPLRYADQAGGTAKDWLHSNAVSYSPTDGNLLLSIRHQDWILKLDYRDGQGSGDILWRLGHDGDFALAGANPGEAFPWFSHQHSIELLPDGRLLTFDNGNTRCVGQGSDCHSRGQVYQLDETNRVATRLVNADMGNFSAALGWAQPLPNGNLSFVSGFQQETAPAFGQVEEFDPSGTALLSVVESRPAQLYRAYRLTTMYDGCCGSLVAYGVPVPNGARRPR
jgi:arylsulfate sulfotransferase